MVPIRRVDWDLFAREVRGATRAKGRPFRDGNIADILGDGPTTAAALAVLWSHLAVEVRQRHAQGGDPAAEPIGRALAQVLSHPEAPKVGHVYDDVIRETFDLWPALEPRLRRLDARWDVHEIKRALVEHLTQVYGDHEVRDGAPPWEKGWGPAMATALALIVSIAFEALGRWDEPAEAAPGRKASPKRTARPGTSAPTGKARSWTEVTFFVEETPCEGCGGLGVARSLPSVADDRFTAWCASCRQVREFALGPVPDVVAPAYSLGPGDEPSRLLDALALEAIAARHLAAAPEAPEAFETLAEYREARRHLTRARIALTELAKHRPGDGAVVRQRDEAAARYVRYVAAERVVAARPGAQPAPGGLSDRLAQHRAWLERGRQGDGRVVLRDERWSGMTGLSSKRLDHAVIEGTRLERVDLSFGELRDATIARSAMVECDLSHLELDRTRLTAVDLAGSRFNLGSLRDAVVEGGDWRRLEAGRSRWSGARLVGVDLREAAIHDAVLDDVVFERCDLRGADLGRRDRALRELGKARGARLVDCDLRETSLDGLRLQRTRFERCLLTGVRGAPVIIDDVTVDGRPWSAS